MELSVAVGAEKLIISSKKNNIFNYAELSVTFVPATGFHCNLLAQGGT